MSSHRRSDLLRGWHSCMFSHRRRAGTTAWPGRRQPALLHGVLRLAVPGQRSWSVIRSHLRFGLRRGGGERTGADV